MKDIFGKLVKYVKETRAETKKVVWPDRRYVTVASVIIIFLVVIIGLYVMAIDLTFSRIFGILLK